MLYKSTHNPRVLYLLLLYVVLLVVVKYGANNELLYECFNAAAAAAEQAMSDDYNITMCRDGELETFELSEDVVNPGQPRTRPQDFELLKLLGKGGYGKVVF